MQDHPRITAPSSDQSWGSSFSHYPSLSVPIIAVSEIHHFPAQCSALQNAIGNVSILTKKCSFLFLYWIKCKTTCKVTHKQELYSQNCKGRRMELTPESLCEFFWTYKYFHLLLPASRLFSFTTAKQTWSDGWLRCYKIIVSWQPMHTCLVEDTIEEYIIQNQWQA